ncbi:MAG: flagellar basal body P-ring protein FlgI [Phycisphaeraceae bacterium]|nr:flagellar basal body P-ring protein FlgI [Phycisphaeraceae bacterium]
MRSMLIGFMAVFALLGITCRGHCATTVKEIARIKGQGENILRGQGLVFGLNGTGESGKELVLARSLAEYYRNNGNPVSDLSDLKGAKNVAIVNVMITIPEGGGRIDDTFDVTVQATHNATSLVGGVLYLTPMLGPLPNAKDTPWAFAQGEVIVEDKSNPRRGRIRAGGRLVKDIIRGEVGDSFTLVLRPPYQGWASANTVAATITQELYGKVGRNLSGLPPIATVIDDRSIRIDVPPTERGDRAGFIGDVLATPINVALLKLPAQVIYNSESQMIIITGDVEISPVAITQKDLTITTTVPAPVATPENPMVETRRWTSMATGGREADRAKLQDLLNAFNQLKIPVTEQVAILSMLEKTGKLHARLVRD